MVSYIQSFNVESLDVPWPPLRRQHQRSIPFQPSLAKKKQYSTDHDDELVLFCYLTFQGDIWNLRKKFTKAEKTKSNIHDNKILNKVFSFHLR